MDPAVLAAVISGSGAFVVATASLVVNAVLENKRGKRQSTEMALQLESQERARQDDRDHQRVERSYADRRDAINIFLTEVDRLDGWAADLAYNDYGNERPGPPSASLDGPDLDRFTTKLVQAKSTLDLLCGPDCREAGTELVRTTSAVALDWQWEGHQDARERFIEAARVDLALPQLRRQG